ncbi:MAG: hypothetical protein A2474_00375 [Elusimicrobia bacterium RIFOXYC2_FULL_34_12]|nr:MAG: hypothetical protein A2474_00375 [Elusimicrobia bacterium RIFOXYC2_FULL_34_12]OGS37916.1 MAG: hypothetical protein A2551_00415 [Elusimicrobia bacterium RIFOXYD2_FULL_34_30]HAM38562.1 hypothetical protein [Elusimicrobiota bacterium]
MLGIPQSKFQQEMTNPSINNVELNKLKTELYSAMFKFQLMHGKLHKITKEWSENPKLYQGVVG